MRKYQRRCLGRGMYPNMLIAFKKVLFTQPNLMRVKRYRICVNCLVTIRYFLLFILKKKVGFGDRLGYAVFSCVDGPKAIVIMGDQSHILSSVIYLSNIGKFLLWNTMNYTSQSIQLYITIIWLL